jgi:hypothetical protein
MKSNIVPYVAFPLSPLQQMMATYPGTPAAIDFSSYTGKLAFTKFAVADIEAAYKKGPVLPPKHEGPSELELAKRAASVSVCFLIHELSGGSCAMIT